MPLNKPHITKQQTSKLIPSAECGSVCQHFQIVDNRNKSVGQQVIQNVKSKESPPKTEFIDKEEDGGKASAVSVQVFDDEKDGGVPSVNPVGWSTLVNNIHKVKGQWVRFHLINQYLGGPGNKKWNLVPTTVQTNNRSDWRKFESSAKSAADEDEAVYCKVEVEYDQKYPKGFPSRIKGTAESYDPMEKWGSLGNDVDISLSAPQLGKGGQVLLYAGELSAKQWELGVGMPESASKDMLKFAAKAKDAEDLVNLATDYAFDNNKAWQDDLEKIEKNILSAASGKRTKNLCIRFA